jgi:hypothetical protein
MVGMRTLPPCFLLSALLACGPVVVTESPGAATDAGTSGADAGAHSQDAGELGADAGVSEPQDAGSPPAATDAGAPRVDAGTTTVDGGPGWEDPGSLTSPARLITADATEFTVDRVGDALTHALAGSTTRHLIVYVHGRACGGGGEPTKSLGGALPELETDYRAKVLMFTWPGSSNGCPLGFPESEARASGTALLHALHKLAWVVHSNPATLGDVTLTFITHSMGSLVLEEGLARDPRPLPATLFSTAMVNSAGSAQAGHRSWLALAHFTPHLYVSTNDGDNVLTAAGIGRGTRLGRSVNGEPLSANASYVDFTAANVNHAYYLHSGQKGAHMRAFYDAIMQGHAYDFATSTALTRTDARDGTFLYVFDGQ